MNKMLSTHSIDQRKTILDSYRRSVTKIETLEKSIRIAMNTDDHWDDLEAARDYLEDKLEPLIREYWSWIEPVKLGTCPFCKKDFMRLFDPIDLNGFWWMDETQRAKEEPEACEHFCLLTGAVDRLNQTRETLFECHCGPERPFVIESILNRPGMQAVISSLKMECGYVAYPICYFSEEKAQKNLMKQSWGRRLYSKDSNDDMMSSEISKDEYEFDLSKWYALGKIWFLKNE